MSEKRSESLLELESASELLRNPVLRLLSRESSLTERQLEAILTELRHSGLGRRASYQLKADALGVSRGSYAKIIGQAMKNIREAMFTVLLVSYLGLLGEERHSWFVELGELLREGRIEEAIALLEEMGERLRTSIYDV
ncbi:MAG: hypothetical protein NZ920_00560 [Aigarchaeota archaeon]|nr:hypothetical protein [Aigarchaeota archaeon]MDW8092934.1 hypothetical protein [Nitrososphaerota archaeon]